MAKKKNVYDNLASGSLGSGPKPTGAVGTVKNKNSPKIPKGPSTGADPNKGYGPSATSVAPKLTGQYDPALDAQYRASQRGLAQKKEDTATAGSRGQEDLMTTLSLAGRNRDRANQDFDTQLQGLFRQFGVQGQQQGQAANAAGVLHGGTLSAAAKVRGSNLEVARQPIDTGRARTGEDYTTSVGQAQQSYDRSTTDANTKLQRAIAESAYYGSDLSQEAIYQAGQNNPDLLALLGGKGGDTGKTPKTPKTKTPKTSGDKYAGQATAQIGPTPKKKKGK